MTVFSVGDPIRLSGATRIQESMAVLRKQITERDWEDRHNMPAAGEITASTKWTCGYGSVWGDGPPYPENLYVSALNNEIAGFPTGDAVRHLGSVPFTLDGDGNICIKPRPLNDAEKSAFRHAGGAATASVYARLKLMSGAAVTYPFGLRPPYGFRMVCKVPTKAGTWPAFWALATDGSWPPENDVFEMVDPERNGATFYSSIHTTDKSWPGKNQNATYVGGDSATHAIMPGVVLAGDDLEHTFREYWTVVYPDFIGVFYKGKCVRSWTTPADFSKPMFAMVNFAVGGPGDWPGTPADPMGDLGVMVVRELDIWRFPPVYGEGVAPPDPGPEPIPPDPTPTPTVVAISVTGPDAMQVSLTINGQPA